RIDDTGPVGVDRHRSQFVHGTTAHRNPTWSERPSSAAGSRGRGLLLQEVVLRLAGLLQRLVRPEHPTTLMRDPCAHATTALSPLPLRFARLGRTTGSQLVQELADLLLGQARQALLRRQRLEDFP